MLNNNQLIYRVTYVSMKLGTLAILAIAATAQAGAVASESSPDSNRPPSTLDETPSRDFGLDVSAVPEKDPSRPKAEEVIPKCAIACIESYVQKHTRCKIADYKCICNHHEVRDCDALTCYINRCGFTKARSTFSSKL